MNLSTSRALPRPLALFAGRASGQDHGIGVALVLVGAALSLALLAGATLGVRDAGAAFPGTNGPIACSGPLQEPNPAPNTSRLELFTMNDIGSIDANGNPTSQARLTENLHSDFNPRYSADGRKIAFIRQTADHPGGSVLTMNADGTNEQQLTFGVGGTTEFFDSFVGGWSPDGSKIVFQRSVAPEGATPRNFEVFTINADGTGLTNLTNNSTAGANSDSQPTWSPNGQQIAFQSNRGGNPDIWVMNADGSNPRNLTADSAAEESAPEWSPDGRQIAFQSDRNFIPRTVAARNLEIYRMNASDGSNVTRLTFNDYNPPTTDFAGYDLNPHWSPQGDRIVFHSGRGSEFGAAQWDVFTINSVTGENPNGGEPARRLTMRDANDERCGWGVLTHRLSVTKAGSGSGTVRSSQPGIDCGDDCSDIFRDPLPVTLTATPAAGSRFVRFSGGGCSGTGSTCTVTMNQARSVTAIFGPPLPPVPRQDPVVNPAAPFADCPTATANIIRGTLASNSLVGTARGDRIFAGTGNDTVDGLAGDDCIDLGPGTDRGQGGDGADLVLGGLGEDRMSGNRGNDRLRGGSAGDRLIGGFGDDRLHGQSGSDRVNGERGRDRINGGSSNDVISAGSSGDRVAGDQGGDRINGNSGNDSLKGNSGRDRITGSTGADRISGGSGNDRINARDGRRDRVNCGLGRDRVVADSVDRVSRNCERVSRRPVGRSSAAVKSSALGGIPAVLGGSALLGLLGWRRRG